MLLGHDDISARDRYLNARGALKTLVRLGVIPVIVRVIGLVRSIGRKGKSRGVAACSEGSFRVPSSQDYFSPAQSCQPV